MLNDYSKYSASDFLNDDFFIESILYSNNETESYWTELIKSEKIDVDEFLSAYAIVEKFHEQQQTVQEERIDAVWNKIVKTNKSKRIKQILNKHLRYIAVACSIASILAVTYFLAVNFDDEKKEVYVSYKPEKRIHLEQQNEQITLISNDKVTEIDGVEVDINYSKNGELRINKKTGNFSQNHNNALDSKNAKHNELRVPYGKRAFITLSDGTLLWVNTGTTVKFPNVFEKEKRVIHVEGEVYVEVFPDKKRPFLIKTEQLEVEVLGTAFNLTAYKGDKIENIVLVNGSLNVKPKMGGSTIISPNQMFSYSENMSKITTVNVENYISWRNGVYIFKNESIENILLRLSRYYNVTMKLPPNSSGIYCSGKLELKDDLNQLLNGLSEITPLNYGVSNDEYRISFD